MSIEKKSLKILLFNSLIYGIAPHISKLINFLILPLITAKLTEQDYGFYGIILAYTSALSAFSMLGLNVVFFYTYYNYSNRFQWKWRQLYAFSIQWMCLYGILQILILYFLLPDSIGENKLMIAFLSVAPTMIMGSTSQIMMLLYQYNHKAVQIAIRTVFFGLLTIVLNLVFILKYNMGYMGWIWSTFIAGVGLNLSYWYPLNIKYGIRPIFRYRLKTIKESLKLSLPTIPHYYASYLLNMGNRIVMEKAKIPVTDIGKYSFAGNFSNAIEMLAMGLGNAFSPQINECYQKKNDKVARLYIWLMQVILLFVTVLCCIWMKEIFVILVKNESLKETYDIAIILIMAVNSRPMYIASSNKLFFNGRTNKLWLITFSAGILNILFCLVFLPIGGYKIAACVYYIALIYMGYSGFFLKDYKEFAYANYYQWKVLFITLILSGFAYLFVNVESLLIKLLFSLVWGGIFIYSFSKLKKVINNEKY